MSNVRKDTSTFIAERRVIHGGCHFQCRLWFFHHPPDLAILSSMHHPIFVVETRDSKWSQTGICLLFYFFLYLRRTNRSGFSAGYDCSCFFLLIFWVLDALRWLVMALVMQLVFSCDCYATHRHDKTSTTPCYVQESLPSQSIILWFSMNLVRWQLLFLMEGDLLYFFFVKNYYYYYIFKLFWF